MLKHKVSVVIPCHNAEAWIHDAILSAISQTLNGVEVIVVDDGSNDGSSSIIRSFGTRVRVLKGQWGNGNAARNQGLNQIRTEWVQFLDADDILQPNKIQSQLNQATDAADAIIGPLITRTHDSDGNYHDFLSRPDPEEDWIVQWLRWELCQTGAALWRVDSLRGLGGWNEDFPCCQDNELIMRAIQAGMKFQLVDGDAAIYRIWSEQTVCRKDPRAVIEKRTDLMDEMLAWLTERGLINSAHVHAAARASFEMARSLAKVSIAEAALYASDRKKLGLFSMGGPAGPKSFQGISRLFGFATAERIAALLRKNSSKMK